MDEIFPLVNEEGVVIGSATRRECHSGTMLLHPVVHLHLINADGELFLQKRGLHKDIQPGKWDTSVGGHIDYGESVEEALRRETKEELGITTFTPLLLGSYIFKSEVEHELVYSYMTLTDLFPTINEAELDGGRFWKLSEIENYWDKFHFTDNFKMEFVRFGNTIKREMERLNNEKNNTK